MRCTYQVNSNSSMESSYRYIIVVLYWNPLVLLRLYNEYIGIPVDLLLKLTVCFFYNIQTFKRTVTINQRHLLQDIQSIQQFFLYSLGNKNDITFKLSS